MNCVNHPDVAFSAYCQSCGRPLCSACMRTVGGVVYCEPCLVARMSPPPGAGQAMPSANLSGLHAHPLLAGLLGFIPGVGAMYNGQFVKALAHVLIFAVFVSLSHHSDVFGLLVAAFVFYQVFDAAQTAKARRDGLPLPNPFGLNDLGARLGMNTSPAASSYASGFAAGSAATGGPAAPHDPAASGTGSGTGWQPAPPPPSYGAHYTPPPPQGFAPAPGASPYGVPGSVEPRFEPGLEPGLEPSRTPVGAVVLIAIGVVLLLQTLGIFDTEWIGRVWPVIIIGIGAWLLIRRTRETPRGGL